MNRRRFLASLGLGTAAMVLDPERLLWVPGAKRIFVPLPPRKFTEEELRAIMTALARNATETRERLLYSMFHSSPGWEPQEAA